MNTIAAAGMGNFSVLIVFVVMIVIMYFTMLRPQKKQQEKRQQMLNQIKKGDSIITIGGLHGKVDSIDEKGNTIVIDADGIYLTFSRSAIRQIADKKAKDAKTETKPETTVEKDDTDSSDNK